MATRKQEVSLVATAALLVFSRVFGLSVVLPVFRPHFASVFEVQAVWIGVAFGAHGLTMALMQLPTGLLSDRIGRRPILIGSSLLFIAGSILAAFAGSIQVLIAARLLQGMGAIGSVAIAAVGETIPAERRTLAMALIGIPAGAGFLLGMAIGPLLYPIIGMSGLFLLTAGLGLAAMLPVPWIPLAKSVAEATSFAALPIAALALGGFVSNYALTTTLFFLPTSDWMTLLPMLVVALLLVGGISRAIDKAGAGFGIVAIGTVAVALLAAAFTSASGVLLMVTGAAFFTAHATLQSTLPSQVSRVAGPAGGRGHGIQNIVAYLGTFVGGTTAGALATRVEYAFVILLIIAVIAAGLTLRARPQA